MVPIGPKMQAHVPPDIHAFIVKEAVWRGLKEPEVLRELLALGKEALEQRRLAGAGAALNGHR
jgi:hypothetical protein